MKKPMFFRDYSYRKELLPVPYLRKLERGRQHKKIREATGFSIGQPGWGLIYYLVQASHSENESGTIVETGSNLGATTVVLAQALLDARVGQPRVISFEIHERNIQIAKQTARKSGLSDLIEFVSGDTKESLGARLSKESNDFTIRFAFLDASHLEKDVRQEFETIFPYLASDALVVFDNTHPINEQHEEPRVAAFINSVVERYGGAVIELPFVSWFTPGLAIWQRSRPDWGKIERQVHKAQ